MVIWRMTKCGGTIRRVKASLLCRSTSELPAKVDAASLPGLFVLVRLQAATPLATASPADRALRSWSSSVPLRGPSIRSTYAEGGACCILPLCINSAGILISRSSRSHQPLTGGASCQSSC